MSKIGAVIQARVGSERLPNKVLLDIMGKTVLEHVVERVNLSNYVDEITIATTDCKQDDVIVYKANDLKLKVFRGSEKNVLSRYYYLAKEYKLDVIVRITSDCPLIDSQVLDRVVELFLTSRSCEIACNVNLDVSKRTYPRGLDVEVFTFAVLEYAYKNASKNYQIEHVTPYIYENTRKICYEKNSKNYSNYRWTLDTYDDFKMICEIYNNLYRGKHDFFMDDIIKLLEEKPYICKVNSHVEQKKIKY